MVNKVEIKTFLGMEVRIVNGTHIVLKDMFEGLGRLREDGQLEGKDTKKLNEFLVDIQKESDVESFQITSKGKKQSRNTQEFNCLKLETVPIVLTQFRPTARKGEEALNNWREFMKFVDDMLVSLEVYKFMFEDKKIQMDHMQDIIELGGKTMLANNQVNIIMAKLMGVHPDIKQIKKEELKAYQNKTTIDLLIVREYVMSKFVSAFEFTGSHRVAGDMALNLALKKYNLAS